VTAWREVACLPEPRHDLDALAHAGRCVAISGLDADTAFPDTLVLDGGAWRAAAPIPTPRGLYGGCVVDGAYYAVGGQTAIDGAYDPVAAVERYDPAADDWRTCASLPRPWTGTAAAWDPAPIGGTGGDPGAAADVGDAPPGRLLAIGRLDENEPTAEVAAYDPAADRWTDGPAMPEPRSTARATTVDGTVLAVGGNAGDRVHGTILALDGEEWVECATMPRPRTEFGMGVAGERCYVVGGLTTGREITDRVACYDAGADAWHDLPPLPIAVGWPGAAVVDDTLYAIGGARHVDDTYRFEDRVFALDL
jgi:hypothetical protein